MELRSKNKTIRRRSFNPDTELAEVLGDTAPDGGCADLSNGASAALELTTASVFSRSKEATCCGWLSSRTVKSSRLRSFTGFPFLSRAVTFTITSSVLTRMVYSFDLSCDRTHKPARMTVISEASALGPKLRVFKLGGILQFSRTGSVS